MMHLRNFRILFKEHPVRYREIQRDLHLLTSYRKGSLLLPGKYAAILILAGLLFISTGCESGLFREKQAEEKPVARVNEKFLYRSELEDATEGLDREDSAVVAKRYIDNWIKEQLMLHRAELALSDEQKDFDRQIEEYRKSLLIYSYRQKLLQQKLDTVVSNQEIQEYYDNNINNFILSDDIIKGTFVKVPRSAQRISQVRQWSRSNTPESLDELEKYCISYAEKYIDFNDKWIYFNNISSQIPMQISQPSRYLRYNRNIETSDDSFTYFLHIVDHKAEGEVAPLELVSMDIRSILLNKRKIEFFQDLETRVYNDGVSRNQFEIY